MEAGDAVNSSLLIFQILPFLAECVHRSTGDTASSIFSKSAMIAVSRTAPTFWLRETTY